MSATLHPQNDRIGDAGLDLTEYLNYYRRPPVFVTEHGEHKHETPLCPRVRGRPHRMLCREDALYVYGERWCAVCRGYRLTIGGSGWTDPRYRGESDG